jgi:hypothetical protein
MRPPWLGRLSRTRWTRRNLPNPPNAPAPQPQTSWLTDNGFILARLTRAKLLHGVLCRIAGLGSDEPDSPTPRGRPARASGEEGSSEGGGEGDGDGAEREREGEGGAVVSSAQLWSGMSLEEALQASAARACGSGLWRFSPVHL